MANKNDYMKWLQDEAEQAQGLEGAAAKPYDRGYYMGMAMAFHNAAFKFAGVETDGKQINLGWLQPALNYYKIYPYDDDPDDIMGHIHKEMLEADDCVAEYMNATTAKAKGKNRFLAAAEIVDIQFACETALALMGYNTQARQQLRQHTYLKNKLQDYYEEK